MSKGDHFNDECGVFGIIGPDNAAAHTALGLHALQHRGQEAAGIVSRNGHNFSQHQAVGKVGDNFNTSEVIKSLEGHASIGHVRYSTTSRKNPHDIQPIYAETSKGKVAIAHNGNITNAITLKEELVGRGCIFRTSMDTEAIIHLLATSQKNNLIDSLIDALKQIEGAYSLTILTLQALIGIRDPYGVRPLALGRLKNSYVLASETCAFDIIGANYIRDIEPGEMVIITEDKIESLKPFSKKPKKFCIFEYVYFSRPDSIIENRQVYEMRKAMGRELAIETPVKADVVIPVPDSGVAASIGYAGESGISFELGIIRNHYVGRTFIEPTDQVRHLGVKLKHNANRSVIEGKSVILIDDSIVRGTTSKKIVAMVREAGAKEVHMRISSPPTTNSCFYGVDTPNQKELLAHKMSIEQMKEFIGVDSLAFLSVDGLYRAVGEKKRNQDAPQYCDACFTGDYPIPLVDKEKQKLVC